jgi:hypothetical protein
LGTIKYGNIKIHVIFFKGFLGSGKQRIIDQNMKYSKEIKCFSLKKYIFYVNHLPPF